MNAIGNQQMYSIEQMTGQFLRQAKPAVTKNESHDTVSFQQVLQQTQNRTEHPVVFSKHANERLVSRNITLTDEQVSRLHQGIEQAREKQIQESLVMMDDLAFIVSVPNNTVVTALEQGDSQHVFTNIDGAVII